MRSGLRIPTWAVHSIRKHCMSSAIEANISPCVGPLNVAARPVQGYPLDRAGRRARCGRELAARTAEMVYTPAQTLELAETYYADVKGRMARMDASRPSSSLRPASSRSSVTR